MDLFKRIRAIILKWHPDHGDGTAYPFWFIATRAGLNRGYIIESNGIWFSRQAALDHLERASYLYPKSAFVYCGSGHRSTDMKDIYAILIDSLDTADGERTS